MTVPNLVVFCLTEAPTIPEWSNLRKLFRRSSLGAELLLIAGIDVLILLQLNVFRDCVTVDSSKGLKGLKGRKGTGGQMNQNLAG